MFVFLRRVVIAVGSLVAGLLIWAMDAKPASAQFIVGRQGVLPIGFSGTIGPVVVGPGRRFVRVGGNFSGTFIRFNGSGFNPALTFRPVTANARARLTPFFSAPPANFQRFGNPGGSSPGQGPGGR